MVLVAMAVLFFTCPSMAMDCPTETKVPDELSPGLDHLLALVSPANKETLDLHIIAKLLDFVASPKPSPALYYTDKKLGASSAYYEVDIQTDLNHLLRYAFNPEIPSFAFMPSVVRLSYWSEVNGQKQPLPELWNLLPHPDSPVIVKGVEHIAITPDLFSGAYYQYDMEKTLILCRYKDRNILISISKQKDISDVGKKGFVLGTDEDWNYFYSGQKGLAITGLGWVDSYMYDSFGISIFYEVDDEKPQVKCGYFKWLRAGWADLNMVKKEHIYKGLERYANDFKSVLEYPSLPDASELAQTFSYLEHFPPDELQKIVKSYFAIIEELYHDDVKFPAADFAEFIQNEGYLNQMTNREMHAILVLEYMKSILGKKQLIDSRLLKPEPSQKISNLNAIPRPHWPPLSGKQESVKTNSRPLVD